MRPGFTRLVYIIHLHDELGQIWFRESVYDELTKQRHKIITDLNYLSHIALLTWYLFYPFVHLFISELRYIYNVIYLFIFWFVFFILYIYIWCLWRHFCNIVTFTTPPPHTKLADVLHMLRSHSMTDTLANQLQAAPYQFDIYLQLICIITKFHPDRYDRSF